MDLAKYSTEIILGVLGAVAVGGSIVAIKKTKQRNNKVNQSNITISGNNGKIVGGDDNSKSV